MRALAIAITLAGAALSACEIVPKPSNVQAKPPDAVQPVVQASAAGVDAALRDAIKGYVGLSTDQEGSVRLTLSDASSFDAAAKMAVEVWTKVARQDGRRLPRFTMVEAAAQPEDLNTAFAKMRDVLTLPNVVFLDLDEARGCITVGIATASAAVEVASFAAAHGVSPSVVKTVVTPRIKRVLDLQDEFRPTMGGLQIQFKLGQSLIGNCSLGLPTWSFNRGKYGFLTASHCTEGTQGGMMGTWFSQRGGRWFWGDKIGVESLDLALFDTNANARCPAGRLCRFSDAAFAEYDQDTLGITGRVMRPSTVCTMAGTSCPLTVARSTDDIRMVYGISGLIAGDLVDKVGRTSGWTRGAITNTCADIKVFDTDATGNVVDTMITFLCQYIVNTTSLSGDSGGPVFEFSATTGNGQFAGILWGGSADPMTATTMIFSPITGIDQELGSFVYNQYGVASPFRTNGRFRTSNVDDELEVTFEDNAVPAGEVEFVLNAGPGIDRTKQIVLVEGPTAGTGQWTIEVKNNVDTARNGLYLYQLPGGRLEFRKQFGCPFCRIDEVSRVAIDLIPGGTRITFNWIRD